MKKQKVYNYEFTNYEYLREGENREINLEYYLLLNEEKNLYGVEVLKKEKSNFGMENIERNSIINYTNDIDKINNVINILSDNKVTPVGLYDVIDSIDNR